jgi:GNAT superfamily N-acetyltransferase
VKFQFHIVTLASVYDELKIRPAELSDSEGIAQVHTLSWKSAYRGLLPDQLLDDLRWQDRKVRWDANLAQPSTTKIQVASTTQLKILGFASVGPCRDDDLVEKDIYELYAMYLSPDVWRKGVGAKLLNSVIAEIPDNSRSISLWVLEGNLGGRAFYESQGFESDGTTQIANILGYELVEIRYRKNLPLDN